MVRLNYEKVLLSLIVEVPDSVFERHSPFSPKLLGQEIANHIQEYVIEEELGYYPALDYCKETDAVPAALYEAVDQLAWLGSSAVRSEILAKLRPLYASVQVKSMQVIAYNMPPARHGHSNAINELIRHYSPNRIKVDLLITLVNKSGNTDSLPEYVKKSTWRNLDDVFESLEISAANLV